MNVFVWVWCVSVPYDKIWWKNERNIWTIRGTHSHFVNKNISIFIRKLAKFTTNSPVWIENRREWVWCSQAKGFLFSRTGVAWKVSPVFIAYKQENGRKMKKMKTIWCRRWLGARNCSFSSICLAFFKFWCTFLNSLFLLLFCFREISCRNQYIKNISFTGKFSPIYKTKSFLFLRFEFLEFSARAF